MTEDKEKRLKDLKQRLTLISASLGNAVNQIKSGKVVSAATVTELQEEQIRLKAQIEKIEKGEEETPSSPSSPQGEEKDVNEYGIPDKLKIKRRPYTMTPDAFIQRKKAAKSSKKAEAMKGNKNAYKTGKYCEGFIHQIFRPCLSSCDKYPCAIVKEGETEPGDLCLDKVQFIRTLQGIQKALKENKIDDLKDLASLRIAGGFEVVQRLITDILEDGALVKSEKWGKDGQLLGYEVKNHPALPFLPKMMEVLNLTPQDFMSTPLIIKKMKTEGKKVKTLADLMSGISFGKKEEKEEEGEE